MSTQLQSSLGPSIEMGSGSDASTGTLVATNRPVLLECLGTIDGWGVGAGGLVEVVDAAVDGDFSLLLSTVGWVVCAEVLDDVVLDERVAGPAVDCEVAVTLWLVGTSVLDRSVKLNQ